LSTAGGSGAVMPAGQVLVEGFLPGAVGLHLGDGVVDLVRSSVSSFFSDAVALLGERLTTT
jgi:hypothetical protein